MTGSRDIEDMFVFTLSSGIIMGYPMVDAIDALKATYPRLEGAHFVWWDEAWVPGIVDFL